MGSIYSQSKKNPFLFDLGFDNISTCKIKLYDNQDIISIYLNAQLPSGEPLFFIFDCPLSNQNSPITLSPICEIPSIFLSNLEPSSNNSNELVLIKNNINIYLLNKDPFNSEIKPYSVIEDPNLYIKFLWASDDHQIICAQNTGTISLLDLEKGKISYIIQDEYIDIKDNLNIMHDICLANNESMQNCCVFSSKKGDFCLFDYKNKVKIFNIGERFFNKSEAIGKIFDNLSFKENEYLLSTNVYNTSETFLFDLRKENVPLQKIDFENKEGIMQQGWNGIFDKCLNTLFYEGNAVQLSRLDSELNVEYNEKIYDINMDEEVVFFQQCGEYLLLQYDKIFEIFNLRNFTSINMGI